MQAFGCITMTSSNLSITSHQETAATIYDRSNLTKLQLLYWVGQKLRPSSPLFNLILTFEIPVELNPDLFAHAFNLLVQSSDTLRTLIKTEDGIPKRHVVSAVSSHLRYTDLSSASNPSTALEQTIHHLGATPLDLETCLFDTALFKLAPSRYIWYITYHHLIADAGSIFLAYRQLMEIYEQLLRGETADPHFPSFEAYVQFEKSARTSPRHHKDQVYWEKKLAVELPAIHFFNDSATKKSTHVQRRFAHLDQERAMQVRQLAGQQTAMTPQMSLSAVFMTLTFIELWLMSGERRLAMMAPFHNRPTAAFRNTLGLLMEICPLVVQIEETDTFRSLLQKVIQEVKSTLLHYQYGSEIALQSRVSDVMFNYHHWPKQEFQGMPVTTRLTHPGHGGDTFALNVYEREADGTFELGFDFHEDVFSPEQRPTVMTLYEALLTAVLTNADVSLSDLKDRYGDVSTQTAVSQTPDTLADRDHKPPMIGPRDMLEFQLHQIWQQVLGISTISIRDNFFTIGGDSWQAMRLFVQIEKLTGQYLPMATLLTAGTIEELATLLRQKTSGSWSNLVSIQKGKPHLRPFFCIPGAGGNGLVIARIAQYLGKDQPIYSFLIPGLVGEELPFTRVEDMATYYLQALRQAQPEGPYLLGGYSAGAIIAFEVAQQLLAQGQKIDFLAIIDAPAQAAYFKTVRRFTQQMAHLLHISPQKELTYFLFLRNFLFRAEYLWHQGLKDIWTSQSQRIGRLFRPPSGKPLIQPEEETHQNGTAKTPQSYHTDRYGSQLEDPRMRSVFETNDLAIRSYVPEPYPGRVWLFKSAEGYKRPEIRLADPQQGWGRVAAAGVDVFVVPGTHMDMVREPHVSVLGHYLKNCLEQIQNNDRN